ncbi:hypothetical protein BST61_g10799 [Cercospora zeina]
MSSSASSSASASPTLEASARGTFTFPTTLPRPRKVTSQSAVPEAIPEDDVPEFRLQYSCCSSTVDQDPLAIKANLTEMLNCAQNVNVAEESVCPYLIGHWIQTLLQQNRKTALEHPALQSFVLGHTLFFRYLLSEEFFKRGVLIDH